MNVDVIAIDYIKIVVRSLIIVNNIPPKVTYISPTSSLYISYKIAIILLSLTKGEIIMQVYGVVTMDIVKSRDIRNRRELQKKLYSYLNSLSEKYAGILVCPVSFVLGDEWELITHKPYECYNLIHEIQQKLWNYEINCYAGIGIGSLSTEVSNDIRMMDGQCFHLARQAINIAKEGKHPAQKYIHSKRNKVFFQSSINNLDKHSLFVNDKVDNMLSEVALTSNIFNDNAYAAPKELLLQNIINTLIENTEILKMKLTKRQKEIYIEYFKFKSYRRMIEDNESNYNGSIGGISQSLNNAEFFTIQRNHEMIKSLLRIYCFLLEEKNE